MIDRQIDTPNQFETHKCSVCNGFGTLKYGSVVCHACKGKGFIVISKKTGMPVEEGESEN